MATRTTIPLIAQQLRRGALTPIGLVEGCLERIKRYDAQVHAWVLVDEAGARDAAMRLGEELQRGRPRSPLHGIPIGVKDVFDVEGWPTRAGSPLRESHTADEDAVVVARLRAGGAIFLGKTVTTEYACFDPSPTRNPWNLAHTPGGSSSGSAAAVALGMCNAALGSQTGGSITRPASYCGVAGLKPTHGRLDLGGCVPVTHHLDHAGVIARAVVDLAAVFDVMATPAPDEEVAIGTPVPPYQTAADSVRPPKLGLIEPFFLEVCEVSVRDATLRAVDRLRPGGAQIAPVRPPVDYAELLPLHRRIMAVEAAAYHRTAFEAQRSAYGPHISQLIEQGLATPAYEYATAIRHMEWFRQHAWDALPAVDALLTPATPSTAPARLDTTGEPTFNSQWSYAGLPTVSLPCALAADGMPLALQLIGRAGGEASLLMTAAWCERRLQFEAAPPLLEPRPK